MPVAFPVAFPVALVVAYAIKTGATENFVIQAFNTAGTPTAGTPSPLTVVTGAPTTEAADLFVDEGVRRFPGRDLREPADRNAEEPQAIADQRTALDLRRRDADGLVIPADAHVRLAAPATNAGARILRRGYSFTDGFDPELGQLDAGLFFIAYQRDPRTGFIPVQQHLSTDALNEYIRHDSTATFACPPGVGASGFVGETLFA